jgi:hypothetical protein
MKMTFHTRDPLSFPEDAAVEIVRSAGGDIRETSTRVAGSFDYLFHFVSIRHRNAKKLRGIYEVGRTGDGSCFTAEERARGWYVHEICRYDFIRDAWTFTDHISDGKRARGIESDAPAFTEFARELKRLATEGAKDD